MHRDDFEEGPVIPQFYIAGFMGAGKSSLLARVKRTDVIGLDLDDVIFKKYGEHDRNLGSYIERVGMETFRRVEAHELLAVVHEIQGKKAVVALGGGTLTIERNMEFLKNSPESIVIWLNVPFEVCYERIRNDSNRPLASLEKVELESLFQRRKTLYARCCDAIVLDPEIITSYEDLLVLL